MAEQGSYEIACILLTCSAANAQQGGMAFWNWEVVTEDGDAIVEPGESAAVTLAVDMTPDVGPGSMTQGFAQAMFDVLGGMGADGGGLVDWKVLNNLDLQGDTAETDGVSLFGISALQLATDPFNDDDPIDVFEFVWKPAVYDDFVVEYNTFSSLEDHGDHLVVVWEGEHLRTSEPALWPIEEASISFQVVPAPAGVVVLGVGGLAAARRRR